MGNLVVDYLLIGIGFYLGLALKGSIKEFTEASAAALIRGLLLGVFFWPIGMIVQIIFLMLGDE